jgi:hypothetical protein
MQSIKIDDNIYFYRSALYQPTFGSHGTIFLSFDLNNYSEYKLDFFSIYDNKRTFKFISSKLISDCCRISTIDIDNNKGIFNLTIKSDFISEIDTGERRDQIIDDILGGF